MAKENEDLIKSEDIDLKKGMPTRELRAFEENPIKLLQATNYKDKPTSLSYNILYQMSVKNSVISAVLNTRVNQISAFTRPKRYTQDGVGFEIKLRDPDKSPTEEQIEVIRALELFIENCGYKKDISRDDFDTFVRKIVRDSLTYDQLCFEVIPDRMGRPAEFVAVDASTIRCASEDYVEHEGSNGDVAWVQVIDGNVVADFTFEEMAFGVRNPRTNINLQPYGFSELEMLIHQITSHLYAEEYNSKFFSQGGTTKGIINLKSEPNGIGNKSQLDSFKRQWQAQVNGLTGAWKTPVLQVPEGVEYINVSQSNREMEFNQWINYLINIVCAVYAIDPAEINFANNGGAAAQSAVFETSQEAKLKQSKDKGMKPLLRFVESVINKYIISRFSQEYVFVFTGLDEKTEQEIAELNSKEAKIWKTINEVRAEHGKEPIEGGDVILDPAWLSYAQQLQMQEKAENEEAQMDSMPTGEDLEQQVASGDDIDTENDVDTPSNDMDGETLENIEDTTDNATDEPNEEVSNTSDEDTKDSVEGEPTDSEDDSKLEHKDKPKENFTEDDFTSRDKDKTDEKEKGTENFSADDLTSRDEEYDTDEEKETKKAITTFILNFED